MEMTKNCETKKKKEKSSVPAIKALAGAKRRPAVTVALYTHHSSVATLTQSNKVTSNVYTH